MLVKCFGTACNSFNREVAEIGEALGRDFRTGPVVVNVVLTDDAGIRDLNRRFRRKDKPTDVLSFESNAPRLPGVPHLLGEVYISRERARVHAEEYFVTYRQELRRLVLHGLFHLLGLTHKQMEPLYGRYIPLP